MTKQLFRFTLFLLVCLIFPLTTMAQTVNIPDPNLRAAVEVALGKASGVPITVDDMGTLTRLDARNANISDLTGLESATNLTHLNLGGNNITDLLPAAGLTDLAMLGLAKNNISDISPLSDLTNLVGLNLEQNTFSDISPLSDLTNLVGLNLEQNTFSDISPLSGLTNLKRLILRHSAISDILPLAGLTNLTDIDLTDNVISDISALSGLTALETLDLKGNPIQDPSPLCILHDRNPELALDIDISCDSDSLSLQNKIDDSEAVKAPLDARATKAARAPSAYVPPITMVSTQMMEDVIYLKDGSIIRGIIVEHIPNESVRIRIQGGSEMIFKIADILKFTKELPIQQPTQQTTRVERRNPLVAFGLSFVLLGAGQV